MKNSDKREKMAHPDQHDIDNWILYGPKNGQISELVRDLTLDCGLGLAEVESLIIAVLEERKLGLSG